MTNRHFPAEASRRVKAEKREISGNAGLEATGWGNPPGSVVGGGTFSGGIAPSSRDHRLFMGNRSAVGSGISRPHRDPFMGNRSAVGSGIPRPHRDPFMGNRSAVGSGISRPHRDPFMGNRSAVGSGDAPAAALPKSPHSPHTPADSPTTRPLLSYVPILPFSAQPPFAKHPTALTVRCNRGRSRHCRSRRY